MPKEWFSQDNLYHYPNRTYTKEQVIAEEQNWQQGYNQYTTENVKTETTLATRILIYSIFFIIPFLLLFIIWLIFGRDIPENKTGYFGMYERDLPGPEDPVQANYLITGKFSKDWFSSAIIYLVWKKQYDLEKRKNKYFLIRNKNIKQVSLPSYIDKIDNFLVKYYPSGEVDLDLLKKSLKLPTVLAVDKIGNWSSLAAMRADFSLLYNKIHLEYEHWFHHKSKLFNEIGYVIATIVYVFCFIGLFIYLGVLQTFIIPRGFLFFLIALVILILIPVFFKFKLIFGKFKKEGRIKNLQWTNFKKYITDFSLMKEHPPKHVVLWEEYMVYATAFGVAKEAAKALKTAMPENLSKNQNFVVYSTFATSSFSTSLGYSTGSSGGGGGFGGGGGGGGGAGAR